MKDNQKVMLNVIADYVCFFEGLFDAGVIGSINDYDAYLEYKRARSVLVKNGRKVQLVWKIDEHFDGLYEKENS